MLVLDYGMLKKIKNAMDKYPKHKYINKEYWQVKLVDFL